VLAYAHLIRHGLGEDYENCFRDSLQTYESSRVHPVPSAPCLGIATLHDFALTLARLGHNLIGSLPPFKGAPTPLSPNPPPLWIRCLLDKFVLQDAGSKKRQRSYEPTFRAQQYESVC
jgi:hypothetical protein